MAYSTISKPSLHFNTKLYTGTGSSNAITGVGFQPDWTWIKQRNGTYGHDLYDVVRGATKTLNTNNTLAEYTSADRLTSFNSDGFTLGTNASVNGSSDTYASWNWLANGAGSANTDGTTTSTVSVNTTAGFSISKYTGTSAVATIGHGLGVVPSMIIVKNLSSGTRKWAVWHNKLSANNKYLSLNETSAELTDSATWNNTAPTNTVFSSSGSGEVNQSGENFIAYCFAEKKGYSKFGSYTGNGNADGTFVYTGFKPAFVIYKRYDSGAYSWVLVDNKRNTFNAVDKYVHPDSSAAEGTVTLMDFLSNGFKMRVNDTTSNQGSIIYMAIAEEPLVANVGASIPATAR